MTFTPQKLTRLIAESHRRQFNGEDYQAVTHDILNREGMNPIADEDALNEIESSPDPECKCGFCATAPWED